MTSWEEEFINRQTRERFCSDLTREIGNIDGEKEEFNECILNPLKYVERKYKDELCTFGRINNLNINDLLDCKKTEKIINLMAEEKEGLIPLYKINREEGIKKALKDLDKFNDKEINLLKPSEQKKTQEKNEKDYNELVESCLPTESHVIGHIKIRPPGSDPAAGEGNEIFYFLRSLFSSKKPHESTTQEIRPVTVGVSHQYQHKTDKHRHQEHLEEGWDEEFFKKLKKEKIIKKRDI